MSKNRVRPYLSHPEAKLIRLTLKKIILDKTSDPKVAMIAISAWQKFKNDDKRKTTGADISGNQTKS